MYEQALVPVGQVQQPRAQLHTPTEQPATQGIVEL